MSTILCITQIIVFSRRNYYLSQNVSNPRYYCSNCLYQLVLRPKIFQRKTMGCKVSKRSVWSHRVILQSSLISQLMLLIATSFVVNGRVRVQHFSVAKVGWPTHQCWSPFWVCINVMTQVLSFFGLFLFFLNQRLCEGIYVYAKSTDNVMQ